MAKVVKEFTDKETRVLYTVGSEYSGTKQRESELTEKGYLEVEKEKVEIKKPTTKKK